MANTSLFDIAHSVCWVEYRDGEAEFSDRQLDELILALKQISMRDCRINVDKTRVHASQKKRSFAELPGKNHLGGYILQD